MHILCFPENELIAQILLWDVIGSLSMVGAGVRGVGGSALGGRWEGVGRALGGCWEGVGRALGGRWEGVGRALGGRWEGVGRALGGRWEGVGRALGVVRVGPRLGV